MKIVSVNVGRPNVVQHGGVEERTAIYRTPTGVPVMVLRQGMAGDDVGSNPPHGGLDQAVYVYGADDYRWWESVLGRTLPPGTFGENLTVEGFLSEAVRIGDRLRIGEAVVLEVTAPRTPCVTLARRMEDPTFVRRFARAGRPGAYTRVLVEGPVSVDDGVRVEPVVADTPIGLVEMAELHLDRRAPADALERALTSPLAERWRAYLEERLESARASTSATRSRAET